MQDRLGRYEIQSVIGQGAMGIVYKALDPVIDRQVAIKTITLTGNPDDKAEYEARFQQEIKASGRVNHPNIVTIFDVGHNDDVAYMAMEYLDGRSLRDIMNGQSPPGIRMAVDWARQIAEGLAAAHELGIIHRDIKPANIMIVKGGLAKITDFGIARMSASAIRTMTGFILGSPRYMSPEQVVGRELDHRTDIFSLGVLLYEMLTRKAPFDGDNVNSIMYATVNEVPPKPSELNPEVPEILDKIIDKAMQKKAESRYASMQEFAGHLQEALYEIAPKRQASGRENVDPHATHVVSDVHQISEVDQSHLQPDHQQTIPLAINARFDSIDATTRLAALTQQMQVSELGGAGLKDPAVTTSTVKVLKIGTTDRAKVTSNLPGKWTTFPYAIVAIMVPIILFLVIMLVIG